MPTVSEIVPLVRTVSNQAAGGQIRALLVLAVQDDGVVKWMRGYDDAVAAYDLLLVAMDMVDKLRGEFRGPKVPFPPPLQVVETD
jgi:hypothetical protein